MLGRGSFSTYNFKGDEPRLEQYNTNSAEYKKAMAHRSFKGKSAKNLKGAGAPEFVNRDPRVRVRAATLIRDCVTVDTPTRSAIKKMTERKHYDTTVAGLLNHAAIQCKAECQRIIERCKKEKKKFFDKSFYFGDRMVMYPPGTPDDCTVTEPRDVARLGDLYPNAVLFIEGPDEDYFQGAIGDCFFIGAVAALWAHPAPPNTQPVLRLFPMHDKECGVYGVLFFKNGGWEWVIVDDLVAVGDDGKSPLYSSCIDSQLWPVILEKAYAKVHYCWDTIDGGWSREALADLTGGLEYSIDLYGTHSKMPFQEFSAWVNDPHTVLGCALGQHVRESGAAGRAGEAGAVYGLFKGHAYSIIRAVQTSDGGQFIRVRNPWGNEAEWTGAYSDRAPEWKKNPLQVKELNPEFKDDGCFWMAWADFRKYFTDIDICQFFADDSKCLTIFGSSPGRTQSLPQHTYILEIISNKAEVPIVAILGQEDPKAQPNHKIAKTLPYAVLQLGVQRLKALPKVFSDLEKNLAEDVETNKIYNRQVHERLMLKPGLYCVTPSLTNGPAGIGYFIRCLCESGDDISLYRFDNKDGTFLSTTSLKNVTQGFFASDFDDAPGATDVLPPQPKPQPVVPQPAPVVPQPRPQPVVPQPAPVVPQPKPQPVVPQPATSSSQADRFFSAEGGLEAAVMNAFSHTDIASRGTIELRTAEHAFGRLLMSSDIGRSFRRILAGQGTTAITRSAFSEFSIQAIQEIFHELSDPLLDTLFSSEGGLPTACRNAFTRTDAWNTGRMYKMHCELAFSRLLMSSEIGRSFRNLLSRCGAYQLTHIQMQRLSDQSFQEGLSFLTKQ